MCLGTPWFAQIAAADDGPPLFARITVLQTQGIEAPVDVVLTVQKIHRSPWGSDGRAAFGKLPIGQPSPWVDITEAIANARDQATCLVQLTSDGQPVQAPAKVRVELARSGDAQTPLASTDVSDPTAVLGLVMRERAASDADIAAGLMSIREVAMAHLAASQAVAVTPEDRPQHFIAATMCITFSGYSDPAIAAIEAQTLLNLGYNTLTDLPEDVADAVGVPYHGGAEGRPPGVDEADIDEQAVRRHYAKRAEGLRKSQGSTGRYRVFAIADEPNWDFPQTAQRLNKMPTVVQRFRQFLRARKMTPKLLDRATWDDVALTEPPTPDASLGERRLWYYSVLFAGEEQNLRYATAARALRAEIGDQLLAFTNWNNPGIMYSNCKPWHAGIFTASHSWFDFSRAGGGTALWLGPGVGEDGGWHRSTLRMWSMAVNLLRSAADQGVDRFGVYLHHIAIPDSRAYELALSIMAVAGRGGQAYNSWTYGPHYAFTECMWSDRYEHYAALADANRLIGRSEYLMHGGERPQAEIAILWPVTSEIYDLNRRGYWTYNRDFLVEAEHIWFALNHHNYPVDFVDETMIQNGDLDQYKLLYIAGPNLEARTTQTVADWVDHGGTLWTSARAALRDEFDQDITALDDVLGITKRQVQRDLVDYSPKGGLRWLQSRGEVTMDLGAGFGEEPWSTYGSRESAQSTTAEVIGRYPDGSPAVMRNNYGKGVSLHFAGMPGLAYSRGATELPDVPTIDYPPRIAQLITAPAEQLRIDRPAITSLAYVESAVLTSDGGMAVTLMNWSAKPIEDLQVTIDNVATRCKRVRSARLGEIDHRVQDGEIIVNLPMPGVVDVLLLDFE